LDPQQHEVVLEIGPGRGVLTERLLPRCQRVVGVEIDPELATGLERRGWKNFKLVRKDILDTLPSEIGDVDAVIGNLPYEISAPLTFDLLRWDFGRAVLMYQKEFAEKMVAEVGDDDYGRLSVTVAYKAHVKLLEKVPPSAFAPPPKVDSAVVRVTPRTDPPFHVENEAFFLATVQALFGQRRKTIRRALQNQKEAIGLDGAEPALIDELLSEEEYDSARPEELSPGELAGLSNVLWTRFHPRLPGKGR
jgi:16S rRNA (adenine1518-N6/adenine1519-N6)-dimethyltransferase